MVAPIFKCDLVNGTLYFFGHCYLHFTGRIEKGRLIEMEINYSSLKN